MSYTKAWKTGFLVALLSLFCWESYAQSQKVTVKVTDEPISHVIQQIENQTNYRFSYRDVILDNQKNVTVNLSDVPVQTALDETFSGTNLSYNILSERSIVVFTSQGKSSDTVLLKGTVKDSKGEPVIGAGITQTGNRNVGTISLIDGSFSLNVAPGTPLSVSCIGYKDLQTVAAANMVIVLQENIDELEEVVVVGYGSQKKVNLTGAIATMDSKKIEDRPITSSTQVLQGMLGVYVNQGKGGQPGADGATIRVRGQGTLNDNNPLILVNGIEFPLDAINPNDIESVSVLKDAASSAIYGSRAANGVILITTKEGSNSSNGAFTIDYSNYFGFQQATYLPDFVYDPIIFMEKRNEAQANAGKAPDYTDAIIQDYKQGMQTDPEIYQNNNWLDIMFKNAFIQEHNLRFAGGAENYTYSSSFGYNDQNGVLRGSDSNTYNFSLHTSAQVTPRLKISANVNSQYKTWNAPVTGVSNVIQMTFKATAFHPTYTPDGRYANTWIKTPGHNKYRHPLALADEGERRRESMRTLINVAAEYKLPFDITYNLNLGANKYDYLMKIFAPEIFEYNLKTDASERVNYDDYNTRHAERHDENDLSLTLYNTLTWAKKLGSHDLKAMAGFSYESIKTQTSMAYIEGFLGNDLTELNAGATNAKATGTSSKAVLMSYFGRLNYSFRDRYLFEANVRYDGSSRFAEGHRWGIFPSFSAGWRISEEPFMKDVAWIENLKLRASWGQLGNQSIGDFKYISLMNLKSYSYPLNGVLQNGAAVDAYKDPNISWETTTMTNLGLDGLFFEGKLGVGIDLFDKQTDGILRTVNLPAQVGNLTGPVRNIGGVNNKGVEVMLNWRNDIGKFHYDLGGNLALVKNRITNLNEDTTISGYYILKEGEPIDSYYMLHCIGIFQSVEEVANSPFQTKETTAGDLKYEDVNNDGKITEEDRKIVGTVIPKATYSFNIRVGYGNLDLEAMFNGVGGVKAYADKIGSQPFWFGCGLPRKYLTDAWTPERGESATLPRLKCYEDAQNDNVRTSDFWLKDASYLRLKNIQLSYRIPKKALNGVVKSIKVFVNAQNVWTWSKCDEFDPEMNLKAGTYYQYPTVRMFTGGLNVSF